MQAVAIVHEFKKNHRETVRTSLQEYEGRRVVDLRVWLPRSRDGVLVPGAKGLTVDRALLPELERAVRAAIAEDARHHVTPARLDRRSLHF